MFQENLSKTKGKEKNRHNIEVKSTTQGSMGGNGKGKGRKYGGGATWSEHAQQDFGRGSAEQTWEVGERREMRDKEIQE